MSSALVGVTGANGTSIFEGKVVTGFSNAEEEQIGKLEVSGTVCRGMFITTKNRLSRSCSRTVSNHLERRMRKPTSHLQCVPILLCSQPLADAVVYTQAKVVHSGNLITGQNPASARPLAKDLLKKLQAGA